MIFEPFIFAPISQFKAMANLGQANISRNAYTHKASAYNKFMVAGSQGEQLLSFFVNRKTLKMPLNEVELSPLTDWRKAHWRSLETNYKKAAFFEFYDYKFQPIFEQNTLFEAIQMSYKVCFDALHMPFTINWVDEGHLPFTEVEAKPYEQVFSATLGFLPSLSILDLIFNQGPMARDYILNE